MISENTRIEEQQFKNSYKTSNVKSNFECEECANNSECVDCIVERVRGSLGLDVLLVPGQVSF